MATTSARRAWPVLGWLPTYRPGQPGHDGPGALTAWASVPVLTGFLFDTAAAFAARRDTSRRTTDSDGAS